MDLQPHSRFARRWPLASVYHKNAVWALILAMALCGRLLAADPVKLIPAHVPGVIVFRNLDTTLQKLDQLLRRIHPDREGLELEEFESGLNLEPGTLDPKEPVVLIFTRPELSVSAAVAAFVPQAPDDFREMTGGERPVAERYEGPDSEGFVMLRRGVGFRGPSRKSLRVVRMVGRGPTLLKTLDEQEKTMLRRGDVFVRLPLARWREEKIVPMFGALSTVVKLMAASGQTNAEIGCGKDMLDFFLRGARQIIDEMESVAVSLTLDQETLGIVHHHRFASGGATSRYLGQVKLTDEDLLSQVPDLPFLMVMASNWRNTRADSISTRMMKYVCDSPQVVEKVSEETRRRLVEQVGACYSQIKGEYFLMGPSTQQPVPMRLAGGLVMEDAEKGLEQFKFIYENAGETMATMLPGFGAIGQFHATRCNGRDVLEKPVVCAEQKADFRKRAEFFYGPGARFQNAAADKTHLVFSVAQPPWGVCEFLSQQKKIRSIRENAKVGKLVERFHDQPHALVLVDLGRMASMFPALAEMHGSGAAPRRHATSAATDQSGQESVCGPLVGWALKVSPESFTGELVMDPGEIPTLMRMMRQISRETPAPVARVPAPPPPPDHPPRE